MTQRWPQTSPTELKKSSYQQSPCQQEWKKWGRDAKEAERWEIGDERGGRGRELGPEVTGSWLHLPFPT